MISVQNVSKSFGSVQALRDISFDIHRGEVVGFLGPNGAGKTTLIRLITGFFSPTEGIVQVDGSDLFRSKPELRRKIGYLAENNPLYHDMTVRAFLNYAAKLKGIPPADRQGAIHQAVDQCGIASAFDRLIGKLSKGYQQRIGMAQALLGDPELFILDEPTNGLDPQQIIEVRNLIQTLGRDRTVILSTHILPEVQMTCERVLILNQGRLAAGFELLELKKTGGNLEEIFLKYV